MNADARGITLSATPQMQGDITLHANVRNQIQGDVENPGQAEPQPQQASADSDKGEVRSKCASWKAHWFDPLGYAYEQNSFVAADRALSIGRMLVPVIMLLIPAVGVIIGFITYKEANWDSHMIVLVVALPTALIFVCSCYWMAYCLVGRIDSKQRPTRTAGYRWPWDFHCTLIGLTFVFIMFTWYGLILPATSGGVLDVLLISFHSLLFLTMIFLLVWLQITDPSAEPVSHYTEGVNTGKHQKCTRCTARMNSGLEGPWTGKIDPSGEVFYPHKRRYHCSRCNRCVYGLDHHCRFMNQCVNDQTYKQWTLFMFTLWCVVVLQFGMSIVVLVFWYGDCVNKCDSGSLKNLDSVASFYTPGLYFTLIYLNIVFCIGLIVFLSKLVLLHIKLVYKSLGTPDRYTMFEHIRDNPPKGWPDDKKKAHTARMQWNDDVLEVALSKEKQEAMLKAFEHAQKTTGLYQDQLLGLSCWEQLQLDCARGAGMDTAHSEDRFDPSGRVMRNLTAVFSLRLHGSHSHELNASTALKSWRSYRLTRRERTATQGNTHGDAQDTCGWCHIDWHVPQSILAYYLQNQQDRRGYFTLRSTLFGTQLHWQTRMLWGKCHSI